MTALVRCSCYPAAVPAYHIETSLSPCSREFEMPAGICALASFGPEKRGASRGPSTHAAADRNNTTVNDRRQCAMHPVTLQFALNPSSSMHRLNQHRLRCNIKVRLRTRAFVVPPHLMPPTPCMSAPFCPPRPGIELQPHLFLAQCQSKRAYDAFLR